MLRRAYRKNAGEFKRFELFFPISEKWFPASPDPRGPKLFPARASGWEGELPQRKEPRNFGALV
jgi:hypothetical protein